MLGSNQADLGEMEGCGPRRFSAGSPERVGRTRARVCVRIRVVRRRARLRTSVDDTVLAISAPTASTCEAAASVAAFATQHGFSLHFEHQSAHKTHV